MANQTTAPESGQSQALERKKRQDLLKQGILQRIDAFQKSGELRFPKDYAPGNAVNAAFLLLQSQTTKDGKPVLEACTEASIGNAMLKMVTLGLSVVKKQCDFIAYGNQLSCDLEYAGNIALAKRYGHLKWIKANAIFEGDDFAFEVQPETGRRKVIKHKQSLDSLGQTKLKGAYAVYELEDGTLDCEVMNIKQIEAAWAQGAAKGNSPAHNRFPDQMAIKTVINRACKLLIRASDDSVLMSDEPDERDPVADNVKQEIHESANAEPMGFDEAEVVDEPAAETPDPSKNGKAPEIFTEKGPDF